MEIINAVPQSMDKVNSGIPENKDTGVKLSFNPNDFAADMAKLAAEAGVTITKPEPIVEVQPEVAPVQPQQATVTDEAAKTDVVVPEKFKTPDGKIDIAKVEKSTVSAEEALAKYLAKERELKQKINEVKSKENAYLNPPKAIAPTAEIPVNLPFAQKIEEDVKAHGLGTVLTKLFTAAEEAAFERAQAKISGVESLVAENTSRRQLEDIGKSDPWVYTEEGVNALSSILNEQPYLMQAKDPYKAAYLAHKGQQSVVSRPSQQVSTPTPTARASAPVPTVQAANQANNANPEVMFDRLTPNQKVEFINRLPTAEQEKWFIRAGFPGFTAR